MLEQGDDPRALLLAWHAGCDNMDLTLLVRAAGMGYAPAQAHLARFPSRIERFFEMAERAAAQCDRSGLYLLGDFYMRGRGCVQDKDKGVELLRQAAELEHGSGQREYGALAFGEHDWQRYYWWGRSVARGFGFDFLHALGPLEALFEEGELGRVLHTVAAVLRAHVDFAEHTIGGERITEQQVEIAQRLVELHDAMLGRARRAIDCWSMAGRRCGVVKDIRVMIAKLAWEEAWRWGERETRVQHKKTKRS
jgi:hypothetical protein